MEKRRRIPPEKIIYNIKPTIVNMNPPKWDSIQNMKITAMIQEIPPRQPFIRRIIPNLRIGKR